MNIGEVVMS